MSDTKRKVRGEFSGIVRRTLGVMLVATMVASTAWFSIWVATAGTITYSTFVEAPPQAREFINKCLALPDASVHVVRVYPTPADTLGWTLTCQHKEIDNETRN